MPRPTDTTARVLGPYWDAAHEKWRLIVITPSRDTPGKTRKTSFYYREKDDAIEEKETLEQQNCNVTVEGAINVYEQHLQAKETSGYVETIRRLRLFFPEPTMLIARVTHEKAKRWYDAFRERTVEHYKKDGTPAKDHGRPISVSYHRAALINARSLFTYCIDERGWLNRNPFAKVKGIGKRNSGKLTHTTDEATKLVDYCLGRAETGDATALGVLLALALALRSSDLTRRIVRDVDQGGAVLRVYDGKSDASNRPRKVPAELQSLVLQLATGRPAFEPLFPRRVKGEVRHHTNRWLREGMVRFCEAAGVPYICPHGLKGTAGEVAVEDGVVAERIFAHLSHEDGATTKRHYVRGGKIEQAAAARGFAVLTGGKQ